MFEYQPTDTGVKESIILTKKPKDNSFRFSVYQENCRAVLTPYIGSIHFIDKNTNKEESVITVPYLLDSSESGGYSDEDVSYSIEEDAGREGGYIVTLTVSESYLDNPERNYPVIIDPTYSKTGATSTESTIKDVYMLSGSTYAGINFWDSGIIKMAFGYYAGEGIARTLLFFPWLTSTVKGSYINSASLTLTGVANASPYCTLQMFRNTVTYNIATVTWNSKPSYNGTVIASKVTAAGTVKNTYNIASLIQGYAS